MGHWIPGGSDGKESTCNAGDPGSIPGSGRSPGEGNGYLFQYSCLENPMDRGAWRATVHGITKSRTQLSDQHTHTHTISSFPGGSVVKNPPAFAGDVSLIPGSGRSLGERSGDPLQYSCLGNPTGLEYHRPWGLQKSQT